MKTQNQHSDTPDAPTCLKPPLQDVFSLSIDDLEHEIWVDAIGFDGIYEVSSLGRIKSLGRWVPNGASERWVKERIRKQVKCNKDGGRLTCPFSFANVNYSINVSQMIYSSFNRNDNLQGFVIAHLNKIPYDNRICNLKKLTICKSRKISENLGNLKPMPVRGQLKYTRENTFYENGVLKEKKCKICNAVKKITFFEIFRNSCFTCRTALRKEKYLLKKYVA